MQRTINPLPKHPSYNHRPTPSLQLLSKLSKFDGYKKYDQSNPPTNETGNEHPETTTFTMNSPSVPVKIEAKLQPGIRESPMSSTAPLPEQRKTATAQMSSTVGKLLFSDNNEELLADEYQLPAKKMHFSSNNYNNGESIIGGVPPTGNLWQTTNQQMSSGENNQDKSKSKKKLTSLTKENFISPITGEAIADYGSWQEDYLQEASNVKKPAQPEQTDEPVDDPIMAKLRVQLNKRGVRGIISLGRIFRIMDDDSSKTLSLSEFKKAMKDFKTGLTDGEVIILFKRFDLSKIGHISYNDFLTSMAGSLNKRRRALVKLAFDKLDRDKSGLVELADIAEVYDTSKHPDVVSKKKTKDEVLLEFLNNFDVGGDVDPVTGKSMQGDGRISLAEFESYYRAISASIDNEDYFELMIRNAWHISGGAGQAANTANRRVLITDASGRQQVVEIEDDMGLDVRNVNAVKSKLAAQGIQNVQEIALFDGADDITAAKSSRPTRPRSAPATSARSKQTPSRSTAALTPAGIQMLLKQIKDVLKSRGAQGFVGLQRSFRIIDDDGSKALSLAEFKKALKDQVKLINLSDADCRMLFEYFDTDKSGCIDFEEFIQGVRDPLNARRLQLINLAFDKLDTDGSGIVDAKEIAALYDASKHPEVLAKRKSPNAVLEEFLSTFDVGGVKDGCVTRDEFINYYHNLSSSIDNEDYFELMIRNAWHISGGEGTAANSTNMRVLVTDKDGREQTVTLQNDLGVKPDDIPKIYARLMSQGVKNIIAINSKVIKVLNVNGVEIVSVVGTLPAVSNSSSAPKVGKAPPFRRVDPNPIITSSMNSQTRPVAGDFSRPPTDHTAATTGTGTGAGTARPATSSSLRIQASSLAENVTNQIQSKTRQTATQQRADIIGETLFDVFRAQLFAKGIEGIVTLQRLFASFDQNQNQKIERDEFYAVIQQNQMTFTIEQVQSLFDYIDSDRSDAIDYNEFLVALRGAINPRILVLLHQIFDKLVHGDGKKSQATDAVTPQQLLAHFDVSKHPDLLHKKNVTEASLYDAFLQSFDVGKSKEGVVTREDFIEYYHNLACCMKDDEYLELLLRSVWHLQAGNVYTTIPSPRTSSMSNMAPTRRPSSASTTNRIHTAQTFAQQYNNSNSNSNSNGNTSQSAGIGIGGIQGQTMNGSVRRPSTGTVNANAPDEQLSTLYRQAIALYNQGDYASAEELFEEASKIARALFPPNHPECIKMDKSIQMVQRKMKSYAAASNHLKF